MRPVRIIAAVVFVILTLVGAPARASAEPARLQVSPGWVTAGARVTLSGSVGSPASVAGSECATGIRLLSRAFDSDQEFAEVPALGAAVPPDGTFTTTTVIPRSRTAGTYPITGRCGGANIAGATLVVRAAPPTPATTPGPTPPAPDGPTVDQLPPSGPMVAGPATQPTSDLPSRWAVPGLAALGGATLAALTMGLLYRRRYPADLSRRGRS
jgi:hypothetical protein